MNATATQMETIPKLRHAEAMRLAKTEYERMLDLLQSLSDEDWSRPTDCARWNVSQVTSHLIAMAQAVAGFPRELMRQQKAGRPSVQALGLSKFDAWTEYQANMHRGGRALADMFADHYPPVLRRRESFPKVLRPIRMPQPPYGWWPFSYLLDDILTRDVWMHRVDISRATARDLVVTPDHDGRFVANVVRELGARWHSPCTLVLTGPAGGRYLNGSGAAETQVDAVEFCRILSGRTEGHGLPTDVVPF